MFNLSYSSAMRPLFGSALLAVCFCFSPSASSAQQLTQQDVYNAFYDALFDFVDDTSGGVGFVTVPVDINFTTLGTYLSSSLYGYSDVGDSTAHIDALLAGVAPALYNFLRSLSATNSAASRDYLETYLPSIEGAISTTGQDVYGISQSFSNLLRLLAPMSFTQSDELRVYDSALSGQLDDISGYFRDLSDDVQVVGTYVQDQTDAFGIDMTAIVTNLSAIYERIAGQNYWDQDPTPFATDAVVSASAEYSEEQGDAEREFGQIALSRADDDYTNEVAEAHVDADDIGLGDLYPSQDHNALIVLHRNRSRADPIPDIEVDFGRIYGAAEDTRAANRSNLSAFASWIDWLSTALAGLLLSVKGLKMWQAVRVASISAQVGEQPIMHLAYHPF